jgi:hypothetical protein
MPRYMSRYRTFKRWDGDAFHRFRAATWAIRNSVASSAIAVSSDMVGLPFGVAPLAVRLDSELKAAQGGSRSGFATRGTEFALPPAGGAGESGSWFTLSSADGHATMAAGTETKWITVAQ